MDNRKRYDVFISYSSEDQKVVEGICGYLERNGYRCFVAYRDIPRGVDWAATITESLEASKMMVVVFSNSFNVSKQTDREIGLASDNDMPILTYRIADVEMTRTKKYYLNNLNWIDAFPNPERAFGQLLDSVKRLTDPSFVKKENIVKRRTVPVTKKDYDEEKETANDKMSGLKEALKDREVWEKIFWGITIGMSVLLLVSVIVYCYCRIVGSANESVWGTLSLVSIGVGIVTAIVAGILAGDSDALSGTFYGITLLMAAILIVSLVIIIYGWLAGTGHREIWNLLCLISLCTGIVSVILGTVLDD